MQCTFLCLCFNNFLEWIFRFRFDKVQVLRNSKIFVVNSELICPIILYTIFSLWKKELQKLCGFFFFDPTFYEQCFFWTRHLCSKYFPDEHSFQFFQLFQLAREGVSAPGRPLCLVHAMQRVSNIVGLTAIRLAFLMVYG